MARSSWLPLAAVAVVFLAAFAWLRQRSSFLAIERDRAAAAAIATRHAVAVADVMALRELVGLAAGDDAWQTAVACYAADRQRLGDELAVVAAVGDRAAAEAARAAAAAPDAAWRQFRTRPAAAPGLQFVLVRDRFAARGRD